MVRNPLPLLQHNPNHPNQLDPLHGWLQKMPALGQTSPNCRRCRDQVSASSGSKCWADEAEGEALMDTSFDLNFPELFDSPDQETTVTIGQRDVAAAEKATAKKKEKKISTSDNPWSKYKGTWVRSIILVPGIDRIPPIYNILGRKEAKLPKDPLKYPSFPTAEAHKSPDEWAEAVVKFWSVFRKETAESKVQFAAQKKGRKRICTDQSPGVLSKQPDSKDTPPAKKVATGAVSAGAGAVAGKKDSYAKAAARNASLSSPFSIIIHGLAGGIWSPARGHI